MGLLDELKKEAEQLKEAQERARESTLAQAELVRAAIEPRMAELYRYFKELKDQLEVVDPNLSADYELPGFGALRGLRQGQYRIFTDDPRSIEKFTFGYAFARDGRHEFHVASQREIADRKEQCWRANLRFATRDANDGTSTFLIDAFVPVTFEFEADLERAAIRLRVKNLGELGTYLHVFEPAKLDDTFVEEIAKCIVGKPNRFAELTGRTVSDTTRMRLREQIEAEKTQKLAEAGIRRKKKVKKKVKKKAARGKESISERFSRTFFGKKA